LHWKERDTMTQSKRYNRQAARQDMNLALDDMLTDAAPLNKHLAMSPKDAHLWQDMQTVDRLFSAEPTLQAPIDFAARVMASIAEGAAQDAHAHPIRQRSDLRAMVALVITVMMLMPVVLGTSLTLYNLLREPAAISVLKYQIAGLLSVIGQSFNTAVQMVTPYATPLLIALGAMSLMFYATMIWIGFTRSANRREMVVYRIPVTVA
jgi:hypothetical protein